MNRAIADVTRSLAVGDRPADLSSSFRGAVDRFQRCKRVFDWGLSLLLAVILLPLMGGIMLLIRWDSPGPLFYAHERIGRGGATFRCWKFRTMVQHADRMLAQLLQTDAAAREAWQSDFKLKRDPRITRVGAWLRKFSLDELPQIFNVLNGEMSLVGPRPIVRDEIARYADDIESYYLVRPGVTGLWQVSGRNDTDYVTRVGLDRQYVERHSLWLDLRILCATLPAVLRRRGAY